MKIEYTKSGREVAKGVDWICYDSTTLNSTYIFGEMLGIIRKNTDKDYSFLLDNITDFYNNSKSRSRLHIYKNENSIELCKPNKILPEIWIMKI